MDNKRLILICEGGVHTVEYFHLNGVFPGAVVFNTAKYKEMLPYLTENDEVLLVIKGLTDFTYAEVYALLRDFDSSDTVVSKVTIMSNVDLGKVDVPYYLYRGDLFYGDVSLIEGGKETRLDKRVPERYQNLVAATKKGRAKAKEEAQKKVDLINRSLVNNIMLGFKAYNDRKVRVMIYGRDSNEVRRNNSTERLEGLVKVVDLFADK